MTVGSKSSKKASNAVDGCIEQWPSGADKRTTADGAAGGGGGAWTDASAFFGSPQPRPPTVSTAKRTQQNSFVSFADAHMQAIFI